MCIAIASVIKNLYAQKKSTNYKENEMSPYRL